LYKSNRILSIHHRFQEPASPQFKAKVFLYFFAPMAIAAPSEDADGGVWDGPPCQWRPLARCLVVCKCGVSFGCPCYLQDYRIVPRRRLIPHAHLSNSLSHWAQLPEAKLLKRCRRIYGVAESLCIGYLILMEI
jgi:hypothetical protein